MIIENFCYIKNSTEIGSLNTVEEQSKTTFVQIDDLQPDYTDLADIICLKYDIEYSDIYSFIYQNVSQTFIPNTERFGLKRNETDNFDWLVINQNNFTQEELIEIYQFGEKLKLIIQNKENEQNS